MTLADHLRATAAAPFTYGRLDCCLFVADWVRARHGWDPAADFRNRYATERHALRLVAAHGGLVPLLDRCLTPPLDRTAAPVAGDVAVVDVAGRQHAAIRTATGWACKGPGRLVVTPAALVAAWSLGESHA